MSDMSNKKIAITGSMGSGKSTVTMMISKVYPTISADAIVADLYRDKNFIREVMHLIYNEESDVLDKTRLAKTIFNDVQKKESLEALIHPLVKDEIIKFQKEHQKLSFAEVPLLFEANFDSLFDKIIVVSASDATVYDRLSKDRGYQKEEVSDRLKHQVSTEYKKERADYIIENDGSLDDLEKQVSKTLKRIEEGD